MKNSKNYDESDDVLTAEFRHRIGILADEEEGLSEVFKSKLGMANSRQQNNQISESILMSEIEKDITLGKYNFQNFIKSNCNTITENIFFKDPLTRPLMPYLSSDEIESMSAVVISHAIKQFCGDIPAKNLTYKTQVPIIRIVLNNLDKRILSGKTSTKGTSPKRSLESLKGKLLQTDSSNNRMPLENLLLSTIPIDPFHLAQFITFYGIIREEFRDEIFSQLCCQVSDNPNQESVKLGWILHVLCAGCFTPSSKLIKFYFSFLNNVPVEFKDYAIQTKRIIHRTNTFGVRFHPTTSLEFRAVTTKKHIMLPVTLADGNQVVVETDSATTASEICHKVADCVSLKDQFGFSIYISMGDKVSSLGNSTDHIMDAIAECEQANRSRGLDESDSDWKFFFSKEIFAPWHDPDLDDRSTELIYKQICKSVMSEEFKFKTDQELVNFVARRWYIEFGCEMASQDVNRRLDEFIPASVMGSDNSRRDFFSSLVCSTFENMKPARKKYTRIQVKRLMVAMAQRKWPLQFSALFEVDRTSGPELQANSMVVAVSCLGVFFLKNEPFVVIRSLHFYEIIDIFYVKIGLNGSKLDGKDSFEISTVKGEKWNFTCANSAAITKLLSIFLDGLRRRSLWAVCIQNFILQDHENDSNFALQQGDVVQLMEESKQKNLKEDFMFGRNERTGKSGSFPYDCIYIFPTTHKPPASYLNIFSTMSAAFVSTLPRKRGAVVLKSEKNSSKHSAV